MRMLNRIKRSQWIDFRDQNTTKCRRCPSKNKDVITDSSTVINNYSMSTTTSTTTIINHHHHYHHHHQYEFSYKVVTMLVVLDVDFVLA